jgi:hypothetical protein
VNTVRRAWDRFWFAPRGTAPLALFRIAIGLIGICQLVPMLPTMLTFFGPGGVMPSAPPGDWSVLTPINTNGAVVALFAVGLLASAAVTVGWHSRVSAVVLAIVFHSLVGRNPGVWSSGDLAYRTLTLLLALTPCGAALSLDRLRTAPGRFWEFPARRQWGVRLIQIQLSIAYLASVTHKLRTPEWRDGTAVSYALRVEDVIRFPFPDWITGSAPIMQGVTWATMVAEVAVGVGVWIRPVRPAALLLGVAMHAGMHYALAFGMFGLIMLSMYLTFLSPAGAERFVLATRDRLAGLGRRRISRTPPGRPPDHPAGPAAPEEPRPTR